MLCMTFGESTKSRTQVQLLYKPFKEGREDIHVEDRPSSPNTTTANENIKAVKKMILDSCRITIRVFVCCQAIFRTFYI